MVAKKAVFLDRDGVINRVVMRKGAPSSPRRLSEFRLRRDAREFVRWLKGRGFAVFVVTNQPDIARGLLDPAELKAMHGKIRKSMPVDDILVCPHDHRDRCRCRKPLPGLITAALRRGIDRKCSFVIGDGEKDMAAGRSAGCATILLKAPYNRGASGDFRARNFAEVKKILISREKAQKAQKG